VIALGAVIRGRDAFDHVANEVRRASRSLDDSGVRDHVGVLTTDSIGKPSSAAGTKPATRASTRR